MSAYIVSDETINKILGYLEYCEYSEFKHAIRDGLGAVTQEELGGMMAQSNCDAVNSRYADSNEVPTYTYRFKSALLPEAYKALKCLIYQFSEGDVPNSPIYKAMDRTSNLMAHRIAMMTPEVSAAKWG